MWGFSQPSFTDLANVFTGKPGATFNLFAPQPNTAAPVGQDVQSLMGPYAPAPMNQPTAPQITGQPQQLPNNQPNAPMQLAGAVKPTGAGADNADLAKWREDYENEQAMNQLVGYGNQMQHAGDGWVGPATQMLPMPQMGGQAYRPQAGQTLQLGAGGLLQPSRQIAQIQTPSIGAGIRR